MKFLIYILFLYLPVTMLHAVPLYIEQVNYAKTNDKKLEEAHKQVKEHSAIAIKESIFVSSFHKQNDRVSTDKKSFCNVCHRQPPHSINERKRTFLNMHSRYISCETCHFQPKNIQLEYRWLNFNKDSNKVQAKRIVPFYRDEAVLIFSDHELAKQAKDKWGNESSIERAKLKLRLHTPLSKQGPECLDCHNNKEQLINLKALGFDDKNISRIQQHSIPRFFSRFSKDNQRLRMSDLLQ